MQVADAPKAGNWLMSVVGYDDDELFPLRHSQIRQFTRIYISIANLTDSKYLFL